MIKIEKYSKSRGYNQYKGSLERQCDVIKPWNVVWLGMHARGEEWQRMNSMRFGLSSIFSNQTKDLNAYVKEASTNIWGFISGTCLWFQIFCPLGANLISGNLFKSFEPILVNIGVMTLGKYCFGTKIRRDSRNESEFLINQL